MKLTTHLHLIPRLRMRGAIPPLLQHVFMALCLIKRQIPLQGVVLSEGQGQLYLLLLVDDFLRYDNENVAYVA
jgi:hypothetical protein